MQADALGVIMQVSVGMDNTKVGAFPKANQISLTCLLQSTLYFAVQIWWNPQQFLTPDGWKGSLTVAGSADFWKHLISECHSTNPPTVFLYPWARQATGGAHCKWVEVHTINNKHLLSAYCKFYSLSLWVLTTSLWKWTLVLNFLSIDIFNNLFF